MIIQDYNVSMQSNRFKVAHHEVEEQLDIVKGNKRIHSESYSRDSQVETSSQSVTVSQSDSSVLMDINVPSYKPVSINPLNADSGEMQLPSELQITKELLKQFFGVDVKIVNFNSETTGSQTSSSSSSPSSQMSRQQWAVQYSYHEIQYQKEGVSFSAAGEVTTGDGKSIQFDFNMEMSNETYEELSIYMEAGNQQLMDPLALNFDGQGVKLTDEKFRFDLDNDGNTEEISFLQQGSGFLVWDKNQNGLVDNGSELFGPETDNGFLELQAYDSDNNQWIDEQDTIFYQLSLWTKDDSGNDQLTSLTDSGVGAIYLESTDTLFDLGEGELKETGIFLQENGGVGSIQEINLLV